jgi:hypothetical protein
MVILARFGSGWALSLICCIYYLGSSVGFHLHRGFDAGEPWNKEETADRQEKIQCGSKSGHTSHLPLLATVTVNLSTLPQKPQMYITLTIGLGERILINQLLSSIDIAPASIRSIKGQSKWPARDFVMMAQCSRGKVP